MRQSKNVHLILIIFISLNIHSCNYADEPIETIIKETVEPTNYLALGNSYTIGQGVSIGDRWPIQLSQQLEQNSIPIEKVDFIAQTGWTTTNLINALEESNLDLTEYKLVSLSIGVNNQYQGKPFALFEAEFDLLLKKAMDIAGGKESVFVVSIPDYGVTPFGSNSSEVIAREIDRYNAFCKQVCEAQDITYIDITPISRRLGDSPGALTNDKLHPSGEQYAVWVEKILPEVVELISN